MTRKTSSAEFGAQWSEAENVKNWPIFVGKISKFGKLAQIASKLVKKHFLQDSALYRVQNFQSRFFRTCFICKSRIS